MIQEPLSGIYATILCNLSFKGSSNANDK